MDQSYDMSIWAFTTNFFQAFDVPLTNGLNTFTLLAADLAGNVTVTNFSLTVDYSGKTNPPSVQVNWPLDGGIVCGTNFVCWGLVSDPTAAVAVQIVDTNSYTNWLDAEVGRDGNFRVERVPLNGGANIMTLTVTDAAGNSTNISLTITQGDMGLSIDAVLAGQTMVTGEVASVDCDIWVNGVQGVNNGDGTWTAQITPIGASGGTVIATAYPNSDEDDLGLRSFAMAHESTNSTQGQGILALVSSPSGVYISCYQEWDEEQFVSPSWVTYTNQLIWQNGQGGSETLFATNAETWYSLNLWSWPASLWPEQMPQGAFTNTELIDGINYTNTAEVDPPNLMEEHCNINLTSPYELQYAQRTADTQMRLATGGLPGSTGMNLWVISCTATGYPQPWIVRPEFPWGFSNAPINPQNISIPSGQFDTNGNLYLVLPDNTNLDVTPVVIGPNSSYYRLSNTLILPANAQPAYCWEPC